MAAAGEPHKSLFMYANSNKAVPKSTRNASLELPSRNPSLEECAMRLSLQDGGPPDVTGGLGSRRRRPRRGSSFVSDYVIQGVIGAGKFSEVLEVRKRDPSAPGGLGKAYACKVLNLTADGVKPGQGQSSREEALRELNQLLLLKHPNLIGLQDFYITDNKCHIITDLSEGGDLRSALDLRGSFPEEDAREILTRLLEGLEYMHKNNVAHRDLKLDNVLIVDNKGPTNVQIADLGMAKFLSAESLHTVCGTPQFMAPEVLLPAETPDKDRYGRVATYNVKADIWSCGVIVYMLLVGFPPFSASGVYDLFRKIRACAYDFKDPAWELVSDEAKDFVTWLLTPDPEKRPSAEQALQHPWLQKAGQSQILVAAAGLDLSNGASQTSSPPPRKPTTRFHCSLVVLKTMQ